MDRNPVFLNKKLVIVIIVLFLAVFAITAIGENVERENTFLNNNIQTPPDISSSYENLGGNWLTGWDIEIWVIATDETSGMDRLEIYFNDELKEIVNGPECVFVWKFHYPPKPNIILKAVAYDLAGNRTEESLNLNELDVNIHSIDNFFNKYLQNIF